MKTLRRLERQARREARRRSPGGEPAAGAPGRGPSGRPRSRRLLRWILVRGGIGLAALLAILVIYPPFILPVTGPVTSRFFLRTAPDSIFLFDVEHHRGIDIGAPEGSPVRAARSGRVVDVAESPTYGLVVDVRHPLGMVTRYAHLSRIDVREGQWVWRRRRLGAVGMTGRATGPHLHLEFRLGDRSLPPGFFLMFHQARRALTGGW